jgi:hypothetical protein
LLQARLSFENLQLFNIKFSELQVEKALQGKSKAPAFPAAVNQEHLDALMSFLEPFDLAGSREKSPSVSARLTEKLLEHVAPSADDFPMIAAMKSVVQDEMLVMEAVLVVERCKDLVAYLNRSGLRGKLPTTTKQEVATRWNSHRPMLHSLAIQWDEVRARQIYHDTFFIKPTLTTTFIIVRNELAFCF